MPDYPPFSRRNWTLFVLGLAAVGIGYLLLRLPPADGFLSLTAGPLFLVLGYCLLIPLAILLGNGRREDTKWSKAGKK